jgi:hypothetical protein
MADFGAIQNISTLTDLSQLKDVLYGVAEADIQQRFASSPAVRTTGTVYGGVRWQRLSEGYLRSNPRRIGGVQLVDTTELRQSFKLGNSGNYARASADSVEFGSEIPKAGWQHPRRPLVVEHQGLVDATEQAITDYLSSL